MSTPLSRFPANIQRDFAVEICGKLRSAGFEALWAGGCVRDMVLGAAPKDYDVATSATPQQVIELFGQRRTVPVGVSFGVVMVLGSRKDCGQIEVATFRADGEYRDGRRPTSVTFCSAEEDARRRDFTINGMFYDPVAEQVIDYVGGRSDLQARIVRAIGDPTARFTEDKLRMLRAVRFAATYEFSIEDSTRAAIRRLRQDLVQVSPERIGQELRRMLAHSTRAVSVKNLAIAGLLEIILHRVFLTEADGDLCATRVSVDRICNRLCHLREQAFEPALALLLESLFVPKADNIKTRSAAVRQECRGLRLSNEETECICWLLASAAECVNVADLPLHRVKPLLSDLRSPLLLDLLNAAAVGEDRQPVDASFLREYRSRVSCEILNPRPFVDGADLKSLGLEAGPVFKELLTTLRNEQLDERICNRQDALDRLRELSTAYKT
ncbi:MAG: CCA tRNA nucleotidyltransferase [Fuerstiella sp.]|nr:CCA tRNA nucleotidyltransferase [Fuerstiella sp.]MCP4855691.1 CCA tRNA nucleotidyltransferase [Fuerstiella sp.]